MGRKPSFNDRNPLRTVGRISSQSQGIHRGVDMVMTRPPAPPCSTPNCDGTVARLKAARLLAVCRQCFRQLAKTTPQQQNAAADMPEPEPLADLQPRAASVFYSVKDSAVEDLQQVGAWYARKHLAPNYCYSESLSAWFCYTGNIWQELTPAQSERIIDRIAARRYLLAQELANAGHNFGADALAGGKWQRGTTEIWRGLRNALAGELPEPPLHLLGTPQGAVDLRDGTVTPHKPELGLRVLTAGNYRLDDYTRLLERLRIDRLGKVLDDSNLDTLLKQIGLTLTGLAQSFTSFVLITGGPGSGKGGIVNLVAAALGGYAMPAPDSLLSHHRNEIDDALTNFIESRPRMIPLDELTAGVADNADLGRLQRLTGDALLSARRPHGSTRSGRLISSIWTAAVNPPRWDMGQGLERRLCAIKTLGQLEDTDKTPDQAFHQDYLDAVITLGVMFAKECYRAGYTPPYGAMETRKETRQGMDPVRDWLMELGEDWHGALAQTARETCIEELGEDMEGLSATAFGRAVNNSGRWVSVRDRRAGSSSAGQRVIRLKVPPGQGQMDD